MNQTGYKRRICKENVIVNEQSTYLYWNLRSIDNNLAQSVGGGGPTTLFFPRHKNLAET